jgi:hypothetical protein
MMHPHSLVYLQATSADFLSRRLTKSIATPRVTNFVNRKDTVVVIVITAGEEYWNATVLSVTVV